MTDTVRVNSFLSTQTHMVLAVTLEDGTPWAVPVAIKRWKGREFEWDSRFDTLHSQALAAGPDAAITMFVRKQDAAEGQLGFYGKGKVLLLEKMSPELGRYRIVIEEAWINDDSFVKRPIDLGNK